MQHPARFLIVRLLTIRLRRVNRCVTTRAEVALASGSVNPRAAFVAIRQAAFAVILRAAFAVTRREASGGVVTRPKPAAHRPPVEVPTRREVGPRPVPTVDHVRRLVRRAGPPRLAVPPGVTCPRRWPSD